MRIEQVIVWSAAAFVALAIGLLIRNDRHRWGARMQELDGEVVGYRRQTHNGITSYAPVYRFTFEGAVHEVTDQVYGSRRTPPEGARVRLKFPLDRPDLARPQRPWTWRITYAVLLAMLAIIVARALGLLH